MKINRFIASRTTTFLAATVLVTLLACPADAAFVSYYVGMDGLATIASGTYAGLSNPNYNRLTFLYAHVYPESPASNHYHSKGIQIYSGPNLGEGATVTGTSSSNYVPEGTLPPLNLSFSSGGLYNGKLISAVESGNAFSALTLEDTGMLVGSAPGSGESVLFNSSGGRWNGPLTGADVHLELVSLTSGLNVGNTTTLNLFLNPGDNLHLDESFSFTPLFWTDANAAPGVYTAQFKLTDESGTFGDSGAFEYRFNVVPEPSSALFGAFGALALLRRRR